jgi:hypothetical protein
MGAYTFSASARVYPGTTFAGNDPYPEVAMIWITLVALTGCSNSPTLIDAYDSTVTSMRTLVDDHATTAADATSMDDLESSEADYQFGWTSMVTEMDGHMNDMGSCHMADGMTGMLDGATTSMASMSDEMTGHMADHADHTDLSQCLTEEADHQTAMDTMLTDMSGYSADWHTGHMSCPMGGM